jgi:hypothetical protein
MEPESFVVSDVVYARGLQPGGDAFAIPKGKAITHQSPSKTLALAFGHHSDVAQVELRL